MTNSELREKVRGILQRNDTPERIKTDQILALFEKVTTDTQKYCECKDSLLIYFVSSEGFICQTCGKPLPQPEKPKIEECKHEWVYLGRRSSGFESVDEFYCKFCRKIES